MGPSKVERSYDELGRLSSEKVFLQGNLLSQVEQVVTPSSRTLRIGSHERSLFYQNDKLYRIVTPGVDIEYGYDIEQRLISKNSASCTQKTSYNKNSLPSRVESSVRGHIFEEEILWTPSGQIALHASHFDTYQEKRYEYSPRGFLESDSKGRYSFDEKGLCLQSPSWTALSCDDLKRVSKEKLNDTIIQTLYDEMGEVIQKGDKRLQWDAFGNLRPLHNFSEMLYLC